MKFLKQCVISTAALLPFAPLASLALISAPAQAQAQASHHATPRIDGFNVDEVQSLTPGTDLVFTLYGTPNGHATLHINGARRLVNLTEVEPGQYEGTYTISSRDTLTARSSVTANLRIGNHVASTVLAESIQNSAGQAAAGQQQRAATAPKIERFDVQPSADLSGGNELKFTLMGTPGGKADMTIAGTTGRFFLPEVRAGEYSGVYTIKRRDHVLADSAVTANLRVGDTITSAALGKSLMMANAPARQPVVSRICNNCGVVESVNAIEVKGDGGYLGTIGGGVVGALLGSQVGGGRGKTAAEIAGALGGAYAGRAIEGNAKKVVHYETVVRLQNGAMQTITTEGNPGLTIGEKVRVTDGQMTRDQ